MGLDSVENLIKIRPSSSSVHAIYRDTGDSREINNNVTQNYLTKLNNLDSCFKNILFMKSRKFFSDTLVIKKQSS